MLQFERIPKHRDGAQRFQQLPLGFDHQKTKDWTEIFTECYSDAHEIAISGQTVADAESACQETSEVRAAILADGSLSPEKLWAPMQRRQHTPKRLKLSLKREEALRATRVTVGKGKLVYVLVADKPLKYTYGKSRIAYIGTTKKGVGRIAQSVAARAEDILSLHGVRTFHARIVTCKPLQNVETWKKLERAMLLKFREAFGVVPKCNSKGKKMKESDEFRYFRNTAVRKVIVKLS